jgi:serine/threonine protein kinase
MAHQQEIKRRIEGDPAVRDRCYRFIEFFEHRESKYGHEHREFCQVFEFIDASRTLTNALENRATTPWRHLVIFAKVLALGIHGLHNVGIVHTDLKPDNVILIPDAAIGTGYRLRLIDLDWSIFADRPAPWHGRQGYVGTPGYLSPEHVRGQVPIPASDVFTTGIMLAQILANRHPFAAAAATDLAYTKAVTTADFAPIVIDQPVDPKVDSAVLERVLNSTLDPDPAGRPTMRQVCDALGGKLREWTSSFEPKGRKRPPKKTSTPPTASRGPAMSLVFEGRVVATANVDAEFGGRSLANVHADSRYLSNPQFRLRRQGAGWVIEHCRDAANDTLVDGKKLEGTLPVRPGMTVCVGNAAKGITKLPLTLQEATS